MPAAGGSRGPLVVVCVPEFLQGWGVGALYGVRVCTQCGLDVALGPRGALLLRCKGINHHHIELQHRGGSSSSPIAPHAGCLNGCRADGASPYTVWGEQCAGDSSLQVHISGF